jgi:hypothetical protein
VDELVELLHIQSFDSEEGEKEASSGDESLMHLSECALAGTTQKKSMRLQGMIKGKQVLLLVD